MSSVLPSVCPLDCPDTCGLLVTVEGDRAVKVAGDPEHPFTQGFTCRKMHSYPQRVHSPRRLTQPLRRNGPKGSGSFAEITWAAALDEIAHRMGETARRSGPEAILPYYYAGHMGKVHRNAGDAFFHKLGATRFQKTICSSTAEAGYAMTLGTGPTSDIESAVTADLILIWGSNTLTTNLHAWPFFNEARRRGAEIVVVDPYRNQTAARADRHLRPRPGSDAALALGMMQVLFAEDLVDHEFLAGQSLGWEALRERAAEYPPSRAAELTGVPAEEIKALAQAWGRARSPFLRLGNGASRQLNGGMATRTVACLPALVGALAKGAGGAARSTSAGMPLAVDRLTRPDLVPAGTRSFNMVRLGEFLTQPQDPPVEMMYVYICNPAVVAPDTSQVLRGLGREDLFLVVQEITLTETAMLADIVLPSATSLEMTDLYTSYGHYYLQMARPVIPPVGQARSLLSVFQDLAGRMGFDEEVFQASEEQIIAWLLETDSPYLAGLDLATMSDCRPHRVKVPANPYARGCQTPSGKVELFSQAMADLGLDPLPDGATCLDPEGRGRYPLQLITPPHKSFLNSSFNDVDGQVDQAGPAALIIHPADAEARGIADGDTVRVWNDRGTCRLRARVSPDTGPGVTVAEGLYWGRHTPGGTAINHLTSQRVADLGGSSAFHCNLVEVGPVA